MVECGEQVGFSLEVTDDCAAHQLVSRLVDHLFDRNHFDHIGKMQIAGAVNSSHSTHPDYILDQVAVGQGRAGIELLGYP